MPFEVRKIITSLVSYTALYIGLIMALGYEYGTGDLIEIEPYWDAFFRPEKWMNDFFVSAQLNRVPNERYLFVELLGLTGPPNAWVALIGHYVCTLGLLAGVDRLAKNWIPRADLRVISILIICLGLYGINTGGNELYYPFLTNSYAAQALGIWAICFLVEKRLWMAIISLVIVSFIHILIGLQLSTLIFAAILSQLILEKSPDFSWKQCVTGLMVYGVLTIPYLMLLLGQVSGGELPSEEQFMIMEFRLPHHFFPAYFPMSSWMIIPPLVITGLIFFYRKNRLLFNFFLFTILGCIVYSLGIYVFTSTLILSTQWFESTIWVEALAVIALIAFYQKWVPEIQAVSKSFITLSVLVVILVTLISISPIPVFKSHNMGEPLGGGPFDEIDISKQVSLNVPEDALFALPPNVTAFKWYAKRASYVDYKAMLHHKEMLKEWYRRVTWLYKINIEDRRDKLDLYNLANENMARRMIEDPGSLKAVGITHVLLPKGLAKNSKPILENDSFAVYQLD